MTAPKTPARCTEGTINRLLKLAEKAMDARQAFDDLFEEVRQLPGWEQSCERKNIAPEADAGDWMC